MLTNEKGIMKMYSPHSEESLRNVNIKGRPQIYFTHLVIDDKN